MPAKRSWLTRGVISIGLASLFSDVSHETATAVLPAFLVTLGGSPALLGVIEGVADFAASGAKLGAGLLGSRLHRKREAAAAGYLVTALGKASFALAMGWPAVLVGRIVAWLGRGFRSPLRDTLLAGEADPRDYGKAFGLERAMDSIGAVIGPLGAVALLSWGMVPRQIFWVTLAPGVLAALLVLFGVHEHAGAKKDLPRPAPLPVAYQRFLVAVGLFGLGDFSRTLLILWAGAGKRGIALFALFSGISAIASYVAGHLSDRVGRRPLLVGSYGLAALVGAGMALDVRTGAVELAVFAASGISVGVLESVERAAAADLLAVEQRPWGFGVLATVTGLGDLVASLAVGLLWQHVGAAVAFGWSALFCGLGALALLRLVPARAAAP